jgi:hypothetical protein
MERWVPTDKCVSTKLEAAANAALGCESAATTLTPAVSASQVPQLRRHCSWAWPARARETQSRRSTRFDCHAGQRSQPKQRSEAVVAAPLLTGVSDKEAPKAQEGCAVQDAHWNAGYALSLSGRRHPNTDPTPSSRPRSPPSQCTRARQAAVIVGPKPYAQNVRAPACAMQPSSSTRNSERQPGWSRQPIRKLALTSSVVTYRPRALNASSDTDPFTPSSPEDITNVCAAANAAAAAPSGCSRTRSPCQDDTRGRIDWTICKGFHQVERGCPRRLGGQGSPIGYAWS